MNDESIISPIVDLFREILYDILGLFLPGAALIYVVGHSPFEILRVVVQPLSGLHDNKRIALLVGASYVLGYAVQGIARTVWVKVFVRNPGNDSKGMKGVSPAGLQTKSEVENSEVFNALRTEVGEYCKIPNPSLLSSNEVQNLAFAVAGDRAADAYNFSFRADLCNGMFIVCFLGFFLTALGMSKIATWQTWFVYLVIYAFLTVAFFLRARFYFNIRGRIIYPIALGVLAELRRK